MLPDSFPQSKYREERAISRQGKTFSREFKLEAVKRAEERHSNVPLRTARILHKRSRMFTVFGG